MREHHRPVLFGEGELDRFPGAPDPAVTHRIAHETARTLLSRARGGADPNVVKRLTHYTDEHGIETISELWAQMSPESLPGVLWRVYLLRSMVMGHPDDNAALFQLGEGRLGTVDAVVAGVQPPAGVIEVQQLTEQVLRGVFVGDFHLALNRAAAFCMIVAAGCLRHADDIDEVDALAAESLTERAAALTDMAHVFRRGAALWRSDRLD
jgi:hypothetical protein